MRWFSKTAKAKATAVESTKLRLDRTISDDLEIDLDLSPSIGFVNIGEAYSSVHEGWWLLSQSKQTVAVNVECPMVDTLLRDSELTSVIERIPRKFMVDLASRPRAFRGRSASDGVALLCPAEVDLLRDRGVETRIDHIRDFPIVL